MGYSSGQQSLSCSRWAIEQDTFGLCDSQRLKELWVLDWQLNDLFDFLDLAVQTTDHLVRAIGDLFDHHERNERIDLVGQDLVQGVRVRTKGDAQRWSEGGDVDVWGKVDDYGRRSARREI